METRQRSSDRPALLFALVGLAAVIGLSILIGFVGSPKTSFNWTLAAVWGTALGTTLLASATGWLAYSTRSEVRATQDLAELTREQQAATDRPYLLIDGIGFHGSPESGTLQAVLKNVGLGPALMIVLTGSYSGHADWQPRIDEAFVTAVRPGESIPVEMFVSFPEPHPPGGVHDAFRIEGNYLDRAHKPYMIETNFK
jgi:hypothetical protein